jgi:AraC-like DNA-binding protein
LPRDDRARAVASALRAHPEDQRDLTGWAASVNVSGRTLARRFREETGVPFGQWRTAVRVQAALVLLAQNQPVSRVAKRVGYDTTSAFVAAFHKHTGVTPGAYFSTPAQ